MQDIIEGNSWARILKLHLSPLRELLNETQPSYEFPLKDLQNCWDQLLLKNLEIS